MRAAARPREPRRSPVRNHHTDIPCLDGRPARSTTMDPMSEYLAHVTIEAKLAAAHERRAGRLLEKERRAERRRRRRLALERWWRGWVANGPEIGSWRLLTAAPTRDLPPSVEAGPGARRGGPPGRGAGHRVGTSPARGDGRGRGSSPHPARRRRWSTRRAARPLDCARSVSCTPTCWRPSAGASTPGSSTSSTGETVSRAPAAWPDAGVGKALRAFPTPAVNAATSSWRPCPRPRRRQRGRREW